MKQLIGSMTAKFAALAVTFGLAAGAWAADPVTIQDASGNNISVYEVSSGFYQDAATYAASTDFYITSKEGLEYFRDLVNQVGTVADTYVTTYVNASWTTASWYTANIFTGKTVHLMTDVDLGNVEWSPIGQPKNAAGDKRCFYGNFDGEGHKVSNLKATTYTEAIKTWYAGLFGNVAGTQTFSNLTIENVTLVGYDYAGAFVGNAGSSATTFNNCHVTGTIDIKCMMTGAFVGGIVGIGTSAIDDCSVEGTAGSTIQGSTVGGLAGTSTRTAIETANTVTDSTVTGVTVKSDDNGGQAGGLVGKATNPVSVTGNTVHDVTVSAEAGKADVLVGGVGGDVTASSNTTDTNVAVISKPEAKLGSEDSAGKGMSLAELAASWGAAYANEVITLGQDVALDKRIYFYKGVTIDLNGHKLTLQAEDSRGFYLDDGSIMVLKDSGTGGTFEHAYVGGIAIYVRTGSSLVFKNGIYNVGGNLTYNNGGTIAIESGVYTVGLSNVAIWTGSGTSTVSGGYFNVTRDTINWVVEGKLVEEVKEGQYAGYYLVRDIVDSDYVAENTTTGKRYLTLSDAMAEAKSGEVVQLIKTAVSGTLSFVPDGVVFNDNGFASTVISGAGTPSDPYLIKDIDLLKAFRNSVNAGSKFAGKYFKLTSDIDLNNEEWTPIGDYYKEFCGVFDGDGHTISNLRVTAGGRNAYGLFGRVMKENEESSKPAGIVNVTINNATVKSPAHWAGALAGAMYTGLAVENCHLKGDIDISVSSDGGYYAGGLVGYGGYVAYVDCSVKGNEGSKISGALYVGGIVAWHAEDSGIIRNCSVEGVSLNGQTWVGGIAGLAHYGNTVAECSVADINVAATDNGYAGQIVGLSLGKAGSLTTVVDNTVDAETVVVTAGGEEVAVQIGTENDPYAIVGWDVEKDTDGKVVGGTFERLATEALADGYILSEPNAQGLYTVEKEPVAQIGETKYTSLAAAVEAVPENGAEATTITMIANEELDATVTIPANKNVVLDLNGHDIVNTRTGVSSAQHAIVNEGTLIIKDSQDDGTTGGHVYTMNVAVSGNHVIVNSGTLTIEGGWFGDSDNDKTNANDLSFGQTVRNTGTAVINGGHFTAVDNNFTASPNRYAYVFCSDQDGATMTINGADVYGAMNGVISATAGGDVTINGGNFYLGRANATTYVYRLIYSTGTSVVEVNGGNWTANNSQKTGEEDFKGFGTSQILLNGGTFTLQNGFPYASEGACGVAVSGGVYSKTVPAYCCATDYSPAANTDSATSAAYPYTVVSDYEAQIVRNGVVVTPKGSLTDMISAAQAGDTVQLLADVNLAGGTINLNKCLTLDGDGHDLTTTASAKAIYVKTSDAVTIKNLTIPQASHGVSVNASGFHVTVTNVDMVVFQRGINFEVGGAAGSELNVIDCELKLAGTGDDTPYKNNQDYRGISVGNSPGATFNITDCKIDGFAYDINVAGSTGSSTFNVVRTEGTGRAMLNVWTSSNTFNLTDCEINGYNTQTGPTEAFGCIVGNAGSQNNTYNINQCRFTANLSQAANSAGGNASQQMFAIRGNTPNSTVIIRGNTVSYQAFIGTDSTEPTGRFGLAEFETHIHRNTFYLDTAATNDLAAVLAELATVVPVAVTEGVDGSPVTGVKLVKAVASVDFLDGEAPSLFATFADAIAAADAAGVDEITILDGTTTSPDSNWKVENGLLVRKVYVAQIGTTKYESLAEALADVPADNTETVTIQLIADNALACNSSGASIVVNKNNVVIDGQGLYKITTDGSSDWDKYKVGGASQRFGQYNLVTVTGTNVTLKDMTIDGGECRGVSCATTLGGRDVTYDGVTYVGRGSAHYYGYGNGTITFTNCTMNTQGYAIHCSNENVVFELVVDSCTVNGWMSCGKATGLTIKDSHFGGADDTGKNGLLAKLRAYCNTTIENTTFSTDYLYVNDSVSTYCGIDCGIGSLHISLDGCSVVDAEGNPTDHDITEAIKTWNGDGENFANAVYEIDLQGDATAGYTGGKFVTDTGSVTCAEGYVAVKTGRLACYDVYEIVVLKKVTFALGENAPDGSVAPATLTYPSGSATDVALPLPTYSAESTTFAGWKVKDSDPEVILSAIPAGANTDYELVATWTGAQKVTITESAGTAEITVTDAWIKQNVTIPEGATEEQTKAAIEAALNTKDENGLKKWGNYVLGLDGRDPNAKLAADAAQGPVSATPITSNVDVPPVDTGFKVEYKLVSVDTNGTTVAEGDLQSTPDLTADIAAMTSETNVVYYKTVAVITSTDNPSVTVEVPSTNTIGVLKVESGAKTTAVAVPWASYDGTNDISVADIVRTANLTPGDELKAYAPDGKYKAWKLNASKEWKPMTVVGGSSETDADAYTVKRGSAVWLTRADPSQPIYLVGGVAATEKVSVALEPKKGDNDPSWNLVGSAGTEPVNVETLLGGNTADKVTVPTATVPKNYEYNTELGKWGYWDSKTYEHTNKVGRVSMRVRDVFVTDDNYIPAGTGFWYKNSGTEKQIDL